MSVRNSQEESALVHSQGPHLHITCAREQGLIVMICCAVKGVVVHIYFPSALDKLHLVFIAHILKYLDRLFNPYVVSAERHICINDLLHSRGDPVKILICKNSVIFLGHCTEISLGNRSAKHNPTSWEHISCGLAEKKT